MTRRLGLLLCLTGVIYVLPVSGERPLDLRWIDSEGVDRPCPPARAVVTSPDRSAPEPFALFEDLAYAAAAGGPDGTAILLVIGALPIVLFGLWCRGFSCALRRLWCTLALGVPLAVALIYTSCFLPGRTIRLGAEGADFVTANLNTKTHFSTGLLSPRQLRDWHLRHEVSVLNVSDRNLIAGALEAAQYNRDRPLPAPMTVIVGEELSIRPDLILLNVERVHHPDGAEMGVVAEEVRAAGGATFIAHPWSRLNEPIGKALERGIEGVEIVNGVIHGGQEVVDAARRFGRTKALLGVTDHKFGPHLNAVTLVPRALARTPRGVCVALQKGMTEVLYAVPGGTVSAEEYHAAEFKQLKTVGLVPALNTLLETSRMRRTIWVGTLLLIFTLWWLSITPVKRPQLRRGVARIFFWSAGLLLIVSPLALQWEVRAALGPIPVPWIVFGAAPLALVVLACAHNLALYEEA
ncbi:MAG: PHP domain-containing protein [Planctomycetota bacterium]